MVVPGRGIGWLDFFKQLYRGWNEDWLSDTAAALTYYAMLSLFPFLLFVVALASLLLDPSAVGSMVQALSRFLPAQVTDIVGGRLTELAHSPSKGLLTVGIVLAIWAASRGMVSLTDALNRCYEVRETRPYWRSRPLAIAATLVAGVTGVIAAAIMFFLPVVGGIIGGLLGGALTVLRFLGAGVLVLALWAFLYWALPNVKPRFQLVTPGSLVGVIAWLAGSWGFSEYVRHSTSYETTYGTLGGVIVLLVWLWLSSAVVLLGAEINKILTPEARLKYH
ncbi:MAG: YihY/virulence factor BrkB family protein, partial [Polyangia bacterium]